MDQPIREARGARVPALGFGTFQLQGEDCYRMVRAALDLGYRHLDTARFYENEVEVGKALADSGLARDEVFLTTKIWREDLSPELMRSSAEAALQALGVDFVDLLLIHWPNDAFPLEESLATLAALRAEGKTRNIGVSNFNAAMVRECVDDLGAELLTNQVEYHVLLGQETLRATVRERDMLLTAYSPLGRGEALADPEVQAIAAKHGATPAQIALAWLLAQPEVVAIPKSSSEARARENLEALGVELEATDLDRLDATRKDLRTIDPPFAPAWD